MLYKIERKIDGKGVAVHNEKDSVKHPEKLVTVSKKSFSKNLFFS